MFFFITVINGSDDTFLTTLKKGSIKIYYPFGSAVWLLG